MPLRIAVLALLLAPLRLFAGDFEVRNAPAWVDRAAVDYSAAVPRENVRWGTIALLDDHQVRVGNGPTVDYYRHVRRVTSPSGVQNASEVEFDFDPSYQRLSIHEIAILRAGQRIEALHASGIRVIEKEDESGDHLYDGMLTAIAFLDDVRPGDVLDYSWSLTGSNPLLAGHYADTFEITSHIPALRIRHRLLSTSGRQLRFRSTLPASAVRFATEPGRDGTIYTWERSNVPAIEVEDDTPDWFDPYDHIEVSEYPSWHEVALWADHLFTIDAASAAAVRKLAATIRSQTASRDQQIVAAIRFVQDDIRYLGIEMGRNSHEPHQPRAVLEQRWGDCKDKSFLLAALLRELGAEAWPALVNTHLRHSLDSVVPSPFAFDHVITAVTADGKTRWIDPTLSDQGGTLATIETPNDERALVIRKETTALTPIVTNEKGATRIDFAYVTRSWDAPTTLTVRSTYTGSDADVLRSDLASMSSADFARERINRLAANQPRIAASAPPEIHDDRDRNTIVVAEGYTIRDLWKNGEWTVAPQRIEDHLGAPDTVIRSTPLAFDFPLDLSENVTVDVPGLVEVETGDDVEETAAFRYESHVAREGNRITIRHSLHAKRDAIDVAAVPEHLSTINEIADGTGVTLTRRSPQLASMTPRPGTMMAGFLTVALAIGIAVGKLSEKRRRRPSETEINP